MMLPQNLSAFRGRDDCTSSSSTSSSNSIKCDGNIDDGSALKYRNSSCCRDNRLLQRTLSLQEGSGQVISFPCAIQEPSAPQGQRQALKCSAINGSDLSAIHGHGHGHGTSRMESSKMNQEDPLCFSQWPLWVWSRVFCHPLPPTEVIVGICFLLFSSINPSMYLILSLCLSLIDSPSLSIFLSLPLSISIYLSIYLLPSLSLSLSLSLTLCSSVCQSFSLSLYHSVSL